MLQYNLLFIVDLFNKAAFILTHLYHKSCIKLSRIKLYMKFKFFVLLPFCFITVMASAQETAHPLTIGDPAPQLKLSKWFKGKRMRSFEKGKIYAIDFWATWCMPCKAALPHLSDLAHKYKGKVNFLAVDIYEKNATSRNVEDFIGSMGHKMDFAVAAQDTAFMATNWLKISNESGIPTTFVVDGEGKIAWIGHPKDLNEVLDQLTQNTWEITEAQSKRLRDRKSVV